jgi:hypothetical protein
MKGMEKNVLIHYNTHGMIKFKPQNKRDIAARARRDPVSSRLKKESTMKKSILSVVLVGIIFLFTTAITAQDCIKLLKIEESPKKDRLLISLEHVKAFVADMDLKEISANIELVDETEKVLETLGKIKNGSIDWSHKIEDGTWLLVKFKKDQYQLILDRVKEKSRVPGFRILVSQVSIEEKIETRTTLKSCGVTFAESADLVVSMKYPFKASPGQSLGKDVSLTIENKGTAPARDFDVQMVLSADIKVSVEPAVYSEEFKDDTLLEQGKETIAELNPGESKTLTFAGSLKVPPGTPPGRYYLAAVVDAGNKIDELNEENNADTRLFMVDLPDPKIVVVELPDTNLIYKPADFGLEVVSYGLTLSDGADWRKCNIKPYIFQVKHAAWEELGFHWEINTLERGIWHITGAKFCKTGGKSREVKLKVEVRGGSRTVIPSTITLKLTDARLEYEPAEGKFRILTDENQIAFVRFWEVVKLKSNLYQIKHTTWNDSFFELDTFKKEFRKVTGGRIGHEGGTVTPLDVTVKVEQ